MSTPFEDLESLADYLPDEGESVVVTRRDGELVCQPIHGETFRDGIGDAELYGRFVLINERLVHLALVPAWTCFLLAFAAAVAFYQFAEVGWNGWYVALAMAAIALLSCTTWIARRRREYFQREIRPLLEQQLRRRGISRYSLVGAIRQHPELDVLLTQLARAKEI